MPSLTTLSVPIPQEGFKDKLPDSTMIMGANVSMNGFIKALLRYGVYDRYYFICEGAEKIDKAMECLKQYPNHERAEVILLDEYWKMKHLDQMVLFDIGPMLYLQASLRKAQGRAKWPITGVTHSLSGNAHLLQALQIILGDLYEYDRLVCTSQAGRQVVENLLGSICDYLERKYRASFSPQFQLPVIPLGTDVDQFQPVDRSEARKRSELPMDHLIFLYVGRFSTHYKMDLCPLMLAFSQVLANNDGRRMSLVLAGDDIQHNLAPKLRQFGNDLGLGDKLVIRPNITNEEKRQLYSAGDVFVSLSDNVQETFGVTIIEAMSAGLPVIGSDWNGYKETIEHGNTGFLVPTYWADCVDIESRLASLRSTMEVHRRLAEVVSVDMKSLVEYIELMSRNASMRQEMGEAGRRRVLRHYNWPIIIKAYEELWADQLEQARLNAVEKDYHHGIDTYDYLNVFGHFSTGVINMNSKLQITPMGRALLENTSDCKPFINAELGGALTLLAEFMKLHDGDETVVVGDFIQHAGSENERLTRNTFRGAAKLVKYGFLDIC